MLVASDKKHSHWWLDLIQTISCWRIPTQCHLGVVFRYCKSLLPSNSAFSICLSNNKHWSVFLSQWMNPSHITQWVQAGFTFYTRQPQIREYCKPLANFVFDWHHLVVFNAERVILSRVQVLAPMVIKPRPIPTTTPLRRGRGGSLDCMWGVQTHNGPPVFLVPFRKDMARMYGAPQPNRDWLPVLGIEPGSLDHESQYQYQTNRPFLTPYMVSWYSLFQSKTQLKYHKTLPLLIVLLYFDAYWWIFHYLR